MKISKYDQDPGKRDRLIAKGATTRCSFCTEHKTIDNFYWQKAHNTPASRCKDCWNAKQRDRWHNDYEFRERHQKYINDWNDAGGRDHINAYRRRLWAEDPEYKAAVSERNRLWQQANKEEYNEKQRERYATDTAYREAAKQRARERKKMQKEQKK